MRTTPATAPEIADQVGSARASTRNWASGKMSAGADQRPYSRTSAGRPGRRGLAAHLDRDLYPSPVGVGQKYIGENRRNCAGVRRRERRARLLLFDGPTPSSASVARCATATPLRQNRGRHLPRAWKTRGLAILRPISIASRPGLLRRLRFLSTSRTDPAQRQRIWRGYSRRKPTYEGLDGPPRRLESPAAK